MSNHSKLSVVLLSGGLDSTCMAYALRRAGHRLIAVSFDYGQRHCKELRCAEKIAKLLNTEHLVIEMKCDQGIFGDSALTSDNVSVPNNHYADDSMRVTVVPNRNAIMLSITYAVACSRGADHVAIAAHSGDHPIYSDCRKEFMAAFAGMERLALAGMRIPELLTPFIDMSKSDIAAIGQALEVPFAETWSCYKGGLLHCGSCGTCVERREAFELAGIVDPTEYEVSHV